MTIHFKLEQLYLDDKKDRKLFEADKMSETQLKAHDIQRSKILEKILPEIDESEIWNCHYACLLLMHSWSNDPKIFKKAHDYAKKAVEMGSTVTKWLYAASLDRWLVSQGKLQKYGTQYDSTTGKILPYDIETTEDQRKKYSVPSLKELKNRM
jgi:hypothetical protein